MRLFPPAKINLFLKITGKRPNGYHEIQSLFAFTDLCDVLEVEKSEKFSLKIDGDFATFVDEKDNLLTRILQFFEKNFGINRNLRIKLTKNIPIGAGLGGGSSDAAFFMMALNEIFDLELKKEELQQISVNFGSDIAFFFEKNAKIVTGCGEIIENYDKNFNFDAILIHPGIFTSTKEVYDEFNGNFSEKIDINQLKNTKIDDLLQISNDLTNSATKITPEIAEILSELQNSGAKYTKMSGSGSACFGIFEDKEKLNKTYEEFHKKFPQFFIRKIYILSSPQH